MSGVFNLERIDDSVNVASTILLGYVDIQAISIRCLASITPGPLSTLRSTELKLEHRTTCTTSQSSISTLVPLPNPSIVLTSLPSFSLHSFYKSQSDSSSNIPIVSLVLINSVIDTYYQPYLIEAVIRFIRKSTSTNITPLRVGVCAGVFSDALLQKSQNKRYKAGHATSNLNSKDGYPISAFVYALQSAPLDALNLASALMESQAQSNIQSAIDNQSNGVGVSQLQELSQSLRIRDSFLGVLISALRASGVPSIILLVPADKPSPRWTLEDLNMSQKPLCVVLASAALSFITSTALVSDSSISSVAKMMEGCSLSFSETFWKEVGINRWWVGQVDEGGSRWGGNSEDCCGGDLMYI